MSASSLGCADHCPFLNRRQPCCGEHLNMQGLDYAFEFCFGRYKVCPVYAQLLKERNARRGQTAQNFGTPVVQLVQATVRAPVRDTVPLTVRASAA